MMSILTRAQVQSSIDGVKNHPVLSACGLTLGIAQLFPSSFQERIWTVAIVGAAAYSGQYSGKKAISPAATFIATAAVCSGLFFLLTSTLLWKRVALLSLIYLGAYKAIAALPFDCTQRQGEEDLAYVKRLSHFYQSHQLATNDPKWVELQGAVRSFCTQRF